MVEPKQSKIRNLVSHLHMTSTPTWNGKWSGEKNVYALVKPIGTSKAAQEKAAAILKEGSFSHRWSDGWACYVSVEVMQGSELAKFRKRIAGFCGYSWMCDHIWQHGRILTQEEMSENNKKP